LETVTQKARLIIDCFNLMGYDAVAIGDDDLSLGKKFLLELARKAKFPFLSSNLFDEESNKLLFQPYVIKEMDGLRIGIFSLLSRDTFTSPSDPRKKGLIFRDHFETAQEMVRELGPQTDLIILLSHLGYPKDVEFTQKFSGIHMIVGGHSGVHLSDPPVFKDTIILQTFSKGMYAARLDLTLLKDKVSFYNIKTKSSLQTSLKKFQSQLASVNASDAERDQWRRAKESYEQALQKLEGKNYFTNTIVPLNESIKDHPDIKKMVDDYKSKFPEKKEQLLHDSRGTYRSKP
jgi:2',3'-cyclic-nucleotide 2'-phosphodiesterase (5'-nucleotidase family)